MLRHRRRSSAPVREQRELLELTCVVDGHSHLVAVDAIATAAVTGDLPALCGHQVMACSMAAPPGPQCRGCGDASARAS